jgi:hypothetical protein
MVGEPVVIAEPSFLEGESSPAVLERFVSQSRNGLRGDRVRSVPSGNATPTIFPGSATNAEMIELKGNDAAALAVGN